MRWVLLLSFACQPTSPSLNVPENGIVVVATAADDFSTGALSAVSLDDWTVYGPIAAVSGDPVVQVIDDEVIQINRLGTDTVRIYDPALWGRPSQEFSVGTGSNPHAAAQCADTLWVSLYESTSLSRYKNGTPAGSVNLSAFADADGIPEMSDIIAFNGTLFVALQRLNREDDWTAEPDGAVVSIDCETEEVTSSIAVGPSPTLSRGPDDSVWVASRTGLQRLSDDKTTVQTRINDFGAFLPERAEFNSQGLGLVIARAEDFSGYALFCVNTETDTATLAHETESYLTDVGVLGDEAWVSARRSWMDETALGGLMVWDLNTCTERTQNNWIDTGLDPVSLAFLP